MTKRTPVDPKAKAVPTDTDGDDEGTTIGVQKVEMVRLQAPDDCTSISVRGVEFAVPSSGIVEAPADLAAELAPHGFLPVKNKRKAAVDE